MDITYDGIAYSLSSNIPTNSEPMKAKTKEKTKTKAKPKAKAKAKPKTKETVIDTESEVVVELTPEEIEKKRKGDFRLSEKGEFMLNLFDEKLTEYEEGLFKFKNDEKNLKLSEFEAIINADELADFDKKKTTIESIDEILNKMTDEDRVELSKSNKVSNKKSETTTLE